MDSLVSDRRFSKAFTDPRFKPMPTFKTKVKIDKRFKAVLTSKDYGHRLVVDKRGRPIHDLSKRGKHEMERYYQISSDDTSSSDSDYEEDDDEENQDQDQEDSHSRSRLAQSQSDVSEAESASDSPAAKLCKKNKKEEDLDQEKKKIKRKKSDGINNENNFISKSSLLKKKVKAEKKKPGQKISNDHVDEGRPAAKRLKKGEEVTPVPDKKKASKKRALAEEDDEEERFSVKRLKKTEEVLSDKKKASKKQAVTEEDTEERFSVNRLKKTEEVLSEKKKSSKKKNSLNEKEDDYRLEEKPLIKRPKKKVVEVVSDYDDDDDMDEEEIDEEEMSSDSDDSESDESLDEEEVEEDWEEEDSRFISVVKQSIDVDHSWNELHKQAPIVSESTHRLAVCNMDWDFVKAQDLFVLFKSFATESGSIRSVTIYPSEFGKERMVEDAVMGPRELRRDLTGGDSQSGSEDSESEDERKKKKKVRSIDSEILKRKAQEEAKAQNEALRGYQLNRLRYYFAVVDCNSVETADSLYKECDGMEYQLSSIKLDLRFIPDDMTFDDPPKDSFADEQVLGDFTPNEFHSTALSRGKVNATWDETEFDRIRNKITNAPREELEKIVEDNLYADTIAPPESDSDSEEGGERPQWLTEALNSDDEHDDQEEIDEDKKISLYRKVLMDKLVADEEKEKVKKQKASEIDKEVEWTTGLKTAYESKLRRNEKIKEESQGVIVDKYLERRREKRRNRLQKKADTAKSEEGASDEDDDESEMNDMPNIIDDSLKEMMESEGRDVNGIKSKSKKKKKADKKKSLKEDEVDEEAERQKAELELLLMRDDDEKKIAKPEKVKEKLSRRQKKKISMQKSEKRKQRREGRLTLDVADERFSAMFTSHHFHLDPNHGQFRKTKNNMELVNEQIKRMSKKSKKEVSYNNFVDNNTDAVEDSRSVSKKLVESLKSKMKK